MLKAIFISGILLGLAAVLSAAGLYQWVDHPRLASRTRVLTNGGRSEIFFIRLPVDRIASLGTEGLGLGAASFPSTLELPADLSIEPLQIDHFKVRDAGGNVIGIASRHAVALTDSAAVAWSISFPSRGALRLVGRLDPRDLEAATADISYQPGESWTGEFDFVPGGADGGSGQVRGGSDEFQSLVGSYAERWHITGISDTGELTGTIELDTTTYLAP